MAGRKVKCPVCGTYNDKEVAVFHNSKYYCKVCYDNKMKESEDYKALISYICELYDISAPTGFILKQIKDFKEQYNYTYRGMKTTLHYFYEIQHNEVKDNTGIGIIPFLYDEVKDFYIQRKNISDGLKGTDVNKVVSEKKVVIIPPKRSKKTEEFDCIGLIDINKL